MAPCLIILFKVKALGNDGELIHPFIRFTNLIPEGLASWSEEKRKNKPEPVVEDTLAVNINIGDLLKC